jgi:dynein intermediate chain
MTSEMGLRNPVEPLDVSARMEVEGRDEFVGFLRQASVIVERALGNRFDPAVDYTGRTGEDGRGAGGGGGGRGTQGSITLHKVFFDERWCRHRVVSDINWNVSHPELLVVAYGGKEDTVSQDPDGVALVWSVNLHSRPEFVFTAQSAVTSVLYSPFGSNFVVGATYSGQIVLWDTRAKSTPVQRTPISAAGHTHPVYSMQIVGTQNAHSLVTASTDGLLCVWSLDKLVVPQERLDLAWLDPKAKAGSRSKPEGISTTCLAFADGEVNAFVAGTEDGGVFECLRHGSRPGVQGRFDSNLGHFGPVTSLDIHPPSHAGVTDVAPVFLTTSIDWTCKLWSRRCPGTPLHTFEGQDYVLAARWSPIHPALFATVDGSGHLDVWNIVRDMETPLRMVVAQDTALNTLRWSADGRRIAVGDSKGSVYVFTLSQDLAIPAEGAWAAFQRKVDELEAAVQGGDRAVVDQVL